MLSVGTTANSPLSLNTINSAKNWMKKKILYTFQICEILDFEHNTP